MPDHPDLQLNKCDAAAALGSPVRRLHLAVLTAFTQTGQPPSRSELENIARDHGIDPAAALTELASRDVAAFDQHGEVRAAYPFSPLPTTHQVAGEGGPTVHAMCAIDALGTSAMIGEPVTITTTEPDTGTPLTVQVDNETASWAPATAVVYAGDTGDACRASAERTCGYINFFSSPDAAHDWASRHPDVDGVILDLTQALQYGIAQFGTLVRTAAHEIGS